jgi:hypothetical protein
MAEMGSRIPADSPENYERFKRLADRSGIDLPDYWHEYFWKRHVWPESALAPSTAPHWFTAETRQTLAEDMVLGRLPRNLAYARKSSNFNLVAKFVSIITGGVANIGINACKAAMRANS